MISQRQKVIVMAAATLLRGALEGTSLLFTNYGITSLHRNKLCDMGDIYRTTQVCKNFYWNRVDFLSTIHIGMVSQDLGKGPFRAKH